MPEGKTYLRWITIFAVVIALVLLAIMGMTASTNNKVHAVSKAQTGIETLNDAQERTLEKHDKQIQALEKTLGVVETDVKWIAKYLGKEDE